MLTTAARCAQRKNIQAFPIGEPRLGATHQRGQRKAGRKHHVVFASPGAQSGGHLFIVAITILIDPALTVTRLARDGERVEQGARILTVSGPARSILTAERPALNILQRLCGIATETARYNAELAGTGARLIDTRKTTPGLRMLEKHAVSCGGGLNHRLGLDNGVMLKDNHIAVAGSIARAVERVRLKLPVLTKIEVECDRLEQVEESLAAQVDVIMLDNMSIADMTTAVKLVNGRAKIEASGGIRIDTIRNVALTGVDYISTSKITQAAPAVDIGLDE